MAGKEKKDKPDKPPKPHKPDVVAGNCPEHPHLPLLGLIQRGSGIVGPSEYFCPLDACDYRRGRFSGKALKGKEKEKKPKSQKLPRGGRKPGRRGMIEPGDGIPPFVKGAGDNEPDWGNIDGAD